MPGTPHTSVALPFPDSSLFTESGPDTVATDSIRVTLPPLPAIPGYELHEEIGRGGMGVVYRGRDPELKRLVAIKMLLDPEFASAEQRLRFKIEAEAVAQLKHPNIVQVYELGEVVGSAGTTHPYMVLEYVEGPTLFRYMRQHQFTQHEAASLMIVVARAIQHAHDHGLIHRDLKPANILMSAEASPTSGDSRLKLSDLKSTQSSLMSWVPKITDFGLVKTLVFEGEGRHDLTRPELMVGTPQYMAPEQANPTPKALSSSIDIYSLGVIFYELLTGRLPYDDKDILKMLMEVQTTEPASPRKLQPRLSADLETICLKCLSKKPEDRYRSAAALADDLTRYLNHEPIQARPLSEWQRVSKWIRRHPAVASLVGLLFSVVSVALVVIGYLWYVAEKKRHEAENGFRSAAIARDVARESEITARNAEVSAKQAEKGARVAELMAKQAEKEARASEHEALNSLYFSKIAQADLLLRQGQIARSNNLLNSVRLDPELEKARCWEWYYLRKLCNPMEHILGACHDYVQQVEFDQAGEYFYAVEGAEFFGDLKAESYPGRLLQFRFNDEVKKWSSRLVYQAPTPLRRMSLVENGKKAVTLDFKGNLVLVDLSRVGELQTLDNSTLIGKNKEWRVGRASSRVILWDMGGSMVELYDTQEERVQKTLAMPGPVRQAWLSMNGQRIGFALKEGTVGCWDIGANKVLWSQKYESEWVTVALDDHGENLAFWTKEGQWQWREAATGKLLRQGAQFNMKNLQLSPRGDRLAIQIGHLGGEEFYVYRRLATGGIDDVPLVLRGHRGRIVGYTFHPDGRMLLSHGADGTARLWNTSDEPGNAGELVNTCVGHIGTVLSATFDPKHQQFITGGMDANVMVWKVQHNAERDQIQAEFNCGGEWISAYTFLDGTSKLAVYEHQNCCITLIDMQTRQRMAKHALVGAGKYFRAPRYDAAFSPSGEHLATTNGAMDQVLLYETRTSKLLWETKSFGGRILQTHFSADGKRLLTAGHLMQQGVNRAVPFKTIYQVWNTATRELICEATLPANYFGFNINHDGSAIVCTQRRADNKAYLGVYEVNEQGKERFTREIQLNRAFCVAFSPDGQSLAAANFDPRKNVLAVWDARTGEPRWQQFGSFEATHVVFSKDSRRIFTTCYNSDVAIFDTVTGSEVLTLKQHGTPRENDYALSPKVVFSQDESMMMVHGWDAGISLWRAFEPLAYNANPKQFEKTNIGEQDIQLNGVRPRKLSAPQK